MCSSDLQHAPLQRVRSIRELLVSGPRIVGERHLWVGVPQIAGHYVQWGVHEHDGGGRDPRPVQRDVRNPGPFQRGVGQDSLRGLPVQVGERGARFALGIGW